MNIIIGNKLTLFILKESAKLLSYTQIVQSDNHLCNATRTNVGTLGGYAYSYHSLPNTNCCPGLLILQRDSILENYTPNATRTFNVKVKSAHIYLAVLWI